MYNNQTITQAINGLTDNEKLELFELITDHSKLLNKLMPGLPLINHVIGQEKLTHPLAKQYDAWLDTKT
jgi:hypothetical protein